MILDVHSKNPDILNISVIPNNPNIHTIDEIPMIIQICSRLWFQKGMILGVCPDIPEILHIADISDIHKITIIIQISLSLWFRKYMTLGVSPSYEH